MFKQLSVLEFSLFMEKYVRGKENELFNFNIIRFKYLDHEAEFIKKDKMSCQNRNKCLFTSINRIYII